LAFQERAATSFLNIFGLHSIKKKIIVFALIATLIPSLAMGWLSYVNNRRFLSEKIAQELHSVTSHASREIDLWLKERLYEVRVFSSSYVVSENLEKISSLKLSTVEKKTAFRRIRDYLKSVRTKFVDYEELMVVDMQENVVATSSDKKTDAIMPEGWLKLAQSGDHIIGNPTWDKSHKAGVMVVAAPILAAHGRILGVLASKLNFLTINKILENYALQETGELYVITLKGALLVSTQPIKSDFLETTLGMPTTNHLFSNETVIMDYKNYRNTDVVGTLKKVPQIGWGIVAEKERDKAYVEVFRLRNMTIGFVFGMLFVIGLAAYLLGLTIVGPLNRLIHGADKVASGDLEVDLPLLSGGELGFLTKVFNHMVERLRQGRDELSATNQTLHERNIELEEISVTDSLTGLYNRKHLQETLTNEVARSERYNRHFGVLMIDIDHFKKYNDTFGHLAGDEVLKKMASVFRRSMRECDYAARYGGEEFLIMLPETGANEAVRAAELIRDRVAKEEFKNGGKSVGMTISLGIAAFPQHGNNLESLIRSADAALYEAKEGGRNRVVFAGATTEKVGKK